MSIGRLEAGHAGRRLVHELYNGADIIDWTLVSYLGKMQGHAISPDTNFDDILYRGKFDETGVSLDTNRCGSPDTNYDDILYRGKFDETGVTVDSNLCGSPDSNFDDVCHRGKFIETVVSVDTNTGI